MTPLKPDLGKIVINALSVVVSLIADLIFHVGRFVIRLTTGKKKEDVSFKLEKNKKTVGVIALILIIAVSLLSILLTTCQFQPSLPKVNLLPFQGIGQVMAEEAAKLLGFDWNNAVFYDAKSIIEKNYNIPVGKMRWFTFDRFE